MRRWLRSLASPWLAPPRRVPDEAFAAELESLGYLSFTPEFDAGRVRHALGLLPDLVCFDMPRGCDLGRRGGTLDGIDGRLFAADAEDLDESCIAQTIRKMASTLVAAGVAAERLELRDVGRTAATST